MRLWTVQDDDLLDRLLAAVASRGGGTSPAMAVADALIDHFRAGHVRAMKHREADLGTIAAVGERDGTLTERGMLQGVTCGQVRTPQRQAAW